MKSLSAEFDKHRKGRESGVGAGSELPTLPSSIEMVDGQLLNWSSA